MAERSGFGQGFGRARGDRGGRGRRDRDRGRRGADEEKAWVPCTKLGKLVKMGKITSLEEIFLHSLPIKEHQIIDMLYKIKAGPERTEKDDAFETDVARVTLIDEVMKVLTVQKQTRAGQRTRFKAFVAVGDKAGFIGLGSKCSKEVATAIRGAIIAAKLSIIPVRRGYWGNKIGLPHTVPMKVSGKCGSVRVRLIPAPRGALIVGSPTTKKLLQFAGVKDCYSASTGTTRTRGNFMRAVFDALSRTYSVLTPDLWYKRPLPVGPYEEFSRDLTTFSPKVIGKDDI